MTTKQSKRVEIPQRVRMEAILDVLRRAGRLNKEQITARVASSLSTTSKEISKALYRDLVLLVDEGKLAIKRFGKANEEIIDFDPDIHKSFKAEWMLPAQNLEIKGQKFLEDVNINIYASESLRTEIKIDNVIKFSNQANYCVRFFYAGKFHQIMFSKPTNKLFFFISRPSEHNIQDEISEIEKKFGTDWIILKIPEYYISSYKPNQLIAHMMIEFYKNDQVVHDFNSTNGTSVIFNDNFAWVKNLSASSNQSGTVNLSRETVRSQIAIKNKLKDQKIKTIVPMEIRVGEFIIMIC